MFHIHCYLFIYLLGSRLMWLEVEEKENYKIEPDLLIQLMWEKIVRNVLKTNKREINKYTT